jgi:hypothetical protein
MKRPVTRTCFNIKTSSGDAKYRDMAEHPKWWTPNSASPGRELRSILSGAVRGPPFRVFQVMALSRCTPALNRILGDRHGRTFLFRIQKFIRVEQDVTEVNQRRGARIGLGSSGRRNLGSNIVAVG